MAKYIVTGKKTVVQNLRHEVSCDDSHEAVKAFQEKYGLLLLPEWVGQVIETEDSDPFYPETDAGISVVGQCEYCGVFLLDGDEYRSGDEFDICKKCEDEIG